MQWSKIKTLFILCFLVLNVFLVNQFMQKLEAADLAVLDEGQEESIEEKLESENISYGNLESDIKEDSYISVTQKSYAEEEINQLTNFEDQTSEVINGNFILSQFQEPIPVPEDASSKEISTLVKNHILYPEEYTYWGWNKDMNVLIFFQLKDDRPFYYNQNGLVLVFLNEANEMMYYTQTMLGDVETQEEKKTIQQPIQALGTLYDRNELYSEDEITDVKIGYYARIITEGIQVFAPTWRVEVNDERNHFVNAIEGQVFTSNDIEFITKTVETDIEKIRDLDEENELKEPILTHLNQKINETGNRSGTE
ncbi:hypothetical protein CIL05_16120 [Virgibacillus profundi]|uniref:Regulatory protein YycH-like domain-containing protein n=1 Tax=Virgibacillus profundi TaxID=2024555 RepID=A0A2A2IBL2_9BACI|nr:two-component system regulatory protein YycI [Virgibacillus profundi]PAV28463.1 hypothetical protein CIL05_16120 [Virgibacillus profundi]PXY52636.1 hypothetical protein CIT14_16265 [Virgibacillus profundi]